MDMEEFEVEYIKVEVKEFKVEVKEFKVGGYRFFLKKGIDYRLFNS